MVFFAVFFAAAFFAGARLAGALFAAAFFAGATAWSAWSATLSPEVLSVALRVSGAGSSPVEVVPAG